MFLKSRSVSGRFFYLLDKYQKAKLTVTENQAVDFLETPRRLVYLCVGGNVMKLQSSAEILIRQNSIINQIGTHILLPIIVVTNAIKQFLLTSKV